MAHNGISLLASEAMDSRSMIKRHVDKFRRPVWLRRVCYGICLVALAALATLVGFQPNQTSSDRSLLSLPATMVPLYWNRETKSNRSTMYIEDVISMDSDVLVLVRKAPSAAFPSRCTLECRYGNATRFTNMKATALHLYTHRVAIMCPAPPQSLAWDVNSILISVGQEQEIHSKVTVHRRPLQWFQGRKLVYESFITDTDVAVFVHGFNHTRGPHRRASSEPERLKAFRCVYDEYFETRVTAQAQGVFRCGHPPSELVHQFAGKKISVTSDGEILPSVAYYHPRDEASKPPETENAVDRNLLAETDSKHHVCSCTMIYNGAKFLKEWVYYNSHLGVEKFFLYDNNSDDDLDEVIATLRDGGFTVQKEAWPWVKTQEAGFSHCSVLAQSECNWMLFTDIDEFFFPSKRFLDFRPPRRNVENSSILAGFIKSTIAGHDKVGQISTFCHNFGPSGWRDSPPQGVTQGYTCRLKKTERHKSLVLLNALDSSLENVIHHFTLKHGYSRKLVRSNTATIYHFKFQAWDEFKIKFHRRAATYVADWTEDRNHMSNDRVPDLGTQAVKPADWESRYCEVRDYGLKNYIQRIFGTFDRDNTLHLPWE